MSQFFNFLGVGAIATAVHYIFLLILVEVFGFNVVLSSGLGAFAGAVTSYILNRKHTFNSTLPHSSTMPKFFAVAGLAVIMNVILMKLFTSFFNLPYFLAQVITTGLLIILTFGLNKLWSFNDKVRD